MSHVCEYCEAVVEPEGTKPPRCPTCGRAVILRDEALKKEAGGLIRSILSILGTIGTIIIIWWIFLR